MELEIQYELSDWKDFQSYFQKKIYRESKAWWESAWVNFILWFIVASVFFVFFQSGATFSWPTAAISAFVLIYFFALMVLSGIKAKRACQPIEGGSFLSPHKFVITDDGIITAGECCESSHKWPGVLRVEKTEKAIYLFVDSINALIFPLSKVPNPEELETIINKNVASLSKGCSGTPQTQALSDK